MNRCGPRGLYIPQLSDRVNRSEIQSENKKNTRSEKRSEILRPNIFGLKFRSEIWPLFVVGKHHNGPSQVKRTHTRSTCVTRPLPLAKHGTERGQCCKF